MVWFLIINMSEQLCLLITSAGIIMNQYLIFKLPSNIIEQVVIIITFKEV